jgi:putative transposase
MKVFFQLYRQENLGVVRRKRRKRAANVRVVPEAATLANQRWSMDFVTDCLESGHAFRTLTAVDQYTRACPTLEPGISGTARSVVAC